jgi:cellulose synthase/poly-beta-1,6-N-acetylglucosamine synthase-like glycosyltransferase
MSEYIISLLVSPKDLPILKELNNFPRVALLYLTYNDAMPEILEKLPDQIYPAYEIFVLDDSTDGKYREVIDRFPYRIIRRDHRGGFKAGAINNWLHQFGKDYRYFIILDSDSVITPDFISSMVRYAEHPDNEKIAVFQSKWLIWNTQNQFPAIIGTLYPLWFYSFYKLANFYDTPMIMGHNNLLRTAYVQEVHGFDE